MALASSFKSAKLKADMLFGRIPTGEDEGPLYNVGNVTAASIQPQSTIDSIRGTGLDNYGQTLDSLSESDDLLVNISLNQLNGKSWALAVSGTESEIVSGAQAVADELCAIVGGKIALGRQNIVAASVVIRGIDITVDDSSGFAANTVLTNQTTGKKIGVVQSVPDGTSIIAFFHGTQPAATDVITDGTNTATVSSVAAANSLAALTTDFTEETTKGNVTVVASGSLDISKLVEVKVNYNYNKDAGSQIAIATDTVVKGRLVIKGVNLVDNKRVHIELREVTLSANSAIPIMGDDRLTVDFSGTAATPSGQSNPGIIDIAA